jgi:hypothetical protein
MGKKKKRPQAHPPGGDELLTRFDAECRRRASGGEAPAAEPAAGPGTDTLEDLPLGARLAGRDSPAALLAVAVDRIEASVWQHQLQLEQLEGALAYALDCGCPACQAETPFLLQKITAWRVDLGALLQAGSLLNSVSTTDQLPNDAFRAHLRAAVQEEEQEP